MGSPSKLLGATGLKNKVLKEFSTREYLQQLLKFAGQFARPVIALKSGCLLWLERDPDLLDVLVRSTARPPRNYGPVFQHGQSLLVLMTANDSEVSSLQVLHFENHRHAMVASSLVGDDSIPPHQPIIMSFDLRSTRFIAAPSVDLNPVLRHWSETLQSGAPTNPAAINEFRREHFERRLAGGGYLVPEAYITQIVEATRLGIVVKYYEGKREPEIDLRDSSGVRIGKAEWGSDDGWAEFADMTISFLPSFNPVFMRNRKFKFCGVPIQVELTSLPCLERGTRIAILEEGIYTLKLVDAEGQYHWRQDNSTVLVGDWPRGGTPRLATRFSYQVGVKLLVLQGNLWKAATVCGGIVNTTRHQVQLEEKGEQVIILDLNDFNHTWREMLVDDSGGYDVCMNTYKAAAEEDNRMIEDAITGRKLRVADQLLAIHIRHKKKGEAKKEKYNADENNMPLELKDSDPFEIKDIKNVHGLVHILLRECRKQERQIGQYRSPAFLIVAAPGSGKTWTMRQLVYLLARAPTPAEGAVIAQAPFVMFVQVLASLIRKHDPRHRECDLDFVEFYIRHTMSTKPAQRQFLLQVNVCFFFAE